jgi:hypothetical protein
VKQRKATVRDLCRHEHTSRSSARGTGSSRTVDRFAGIQPTQRKLVISGAVSQPNEAPHAGYFGVLSPDELSGSPEAQTPVGLYGPQHSKGTFL